MQPTLSSSRAGSGAAEPPNGPVIFLLAHFDMPSSSGCSSRLSGPTLSSFLPADQPALKPSRLVSAGQSIRSPDPFEPSKVRLCACYRTSSIEISAHDGP